jgi:hypothetical protein
MIHFHGVISYLDRVCVVIMSLSKISLDCHDRHQNPHVPVLL